MYGVLGHDYALQSSTGLETINFGIKHAPNAGPIAYTTDLHANVLPLYYGC